MRYVSRTCVLALSLSVAGSAATVNFDSLASGVAVTNQFAGLGVIFNAGFATQSNNFGGTLIVPSPPNYAAISGSPSFVFQASGMMAVTDFVSFDNLGLTSTGSFLTGATVNALDVNGNVLASATIPPVGPNQARSVFTTSFNIPGIQAISFTRIPNAAGPALLAIDNVVFDAPVAVPEPVSAALLGFGLAVVALARRRYSA